jgi:dCTP deaminase
MYLSDRDLRHAIENGRLIVEPKPSKIDPTSIDLHLDSIEKAMVWDIAKFAQENTEAGRPPRRLRTSEIIYEPFSRRYLKKVSTTVTEKVYRDGNQVIIAQGGLLLWQTQEWIGTPEENAGLIGFIDGKSTRARTGLVIHLTAPTIHSSWAGHVTMEIVNLGPFDLVLQEYDVVAQLTVSTITSPPDMTMTDSVTFGQSGVGASKDV